MDIQKVVTEILVKEGWDKYTNYPNDRGGPTKWGVTLRAWSEHIGHKATEDDVRGITEEQAREFYAYRYIKLPGFSHIKDDLLAEFTIDCGVNHGLNRASRWLQKVAGATQDGRVGPLTLKAVNSQSPLYLFLNMYAIRIEFYAYIASDQLPTDPDLPNLRGWMNRANSFLTRAATEYELQPD